MTANPSWLTPATSAPSTDTSPSWLKKTTPEQEPSWLKKPAQQPAQPTGPSWLKPSAQKEYAGTNVTPTDANLASYMSAFNAASKATGTPVWLLKAIMGQETGVNTDPRVRNSSRNSIGASGPMQFMPDTAKGFGIDPFNPTQAIMAAARSAAEVKKKYPHASWAQAATYRDTDPQTFDRYMNGGTLPDETGQYLANMQYAENRANANIASAQPGLARRAIQVGNQVEGSTHWWGTEQTQKPAQKPGFDPVATSEGLWSGIFSIPYAASTAIAAASVAKALDFQRWALATGYTGTGDTDEQMERIRSHIPGRLVDPFNLTGQGDKSFNEMYHMTPTNENDPRNHYHTGIGEIPIAGPAGQLMSVNLDNIQRWGGQVGRGLVDAALQTATDPLTYETLGVGALFKQVGRLSPALEQQMMKAINSQPLFTEIYDFLNWGGEVNRTKGVAAGDTLRGEVHHAKAGGAVLTGRMQRIAEKAVDGIDDAGRKKVAQALNGEIDPATLDPNEARAFRHLRTLTTIDYAQRVKVAESIALRNHGRDLTPAQRTLLKGHLDRAERPTIPQPGNRVKTVTGQKPVQTIVHQPQEGPVNMMDEVNKVVDKLGIQGDTKQTRALAQYMLGDDSAMAGMDAKTQVEAVRLRDMHNQKMGRDAHEVQVGGGQQYQMPFENQADIDQATLLQQRYDTIQGYVDRKVPFRENYMPETHVGSKEGTPGFDHTLGEYYDPRFEHREDFQVTSGKQLMDGFKAMAMNAGRQRTTMMVGDALGDMLDDPVIRKALTEHIPATGNQRTDWEKVKDGMRAVVGYPRAGIVSMTPRHAVNILDLLVNTVPLEEQGNVLKETMTLAGQLFEASPQEYERLTAEGREMGSTGGQFTEREPFFQRFPDKQFMGKLAGQKIPGLSSWTEANNRFVWAVDTAAKQTYAKMLLRTGRALNARQAGGMAARHLVDYELLSNAQKALRLVAPFGTFRGGIPGAVMGGIARSPMRAALLSRLTGGTMYGDKPGGSQGFYMLNPTAEVGRGLSWGTDDSGEGVGLQNSGPMGYVTSTLGIPGSIAEQFSQSPHPFHGNKYGEPWMPEMNNDGTWNIGILANEALAGVPEAQTLLNAMGIGQFQWRGLAAEAARQNAGLMLPESQIPQ